MWIVSYDISNHKVRRSVFKTLNGYGTRMQYSVFLMATSQKNHENMMKKLVNISKGMGFKSTDSIVVLSICKRCYMNKSLIGKTLRIIDTETCFIV